MKNTKRSLLTSLLSLLLCVSMLVGSTFAWFTDSVTSRNNKIQSGNLVMDLELLDKDTGEWNSIKESQDPIFNYALWEPGYTDVKVLKIENEGSLALKWVAEINSTTELSKLAEAIDVYVCPSEQELSYPGNRTLDGYTKVGTLAEFANTIKQTTNGHLLANEAEYLGIALKMQESAGNEYQDLDLGGNVDITIRATQYTYEKDSFDENYDAGLEPVEDGDVLVENDGIQYVYTQEGEIVLHLVPEDYALDTVNIMEGTTSLGNYAFAKNDNVKTVILPSTVRSLGRGFDGSNVEKVVLNEGLEVIDSRAFRATPNLQEVVIPSTVKEIADNAFQKSGIKNIVIPATVETIGEAAFGASMIETVTIEGNTSVQGYAFRGCTKLRKVVINGDDVEFIPSTLNGRNSMWFCNGESNNPNTSKIDFYVVNDTMKQRVLTAMGAEKNNTKVYVNGVIEVAVTTNEELFTELANAEPGTVINGNGLEATIDQTNFNLNAGVEIKNVDFKVTVATCYIIASGSDSDLVLKNCTFEHTSDGQILLASDADGGNLVFNNCVFDGPIMPNFTQNADGISTFNNCTFKVLNSGLKNGYVNCMGGTHNFVNCTFDYTGGTTFGSNQYVKWNAVNSYSERYSTSVNLQGCTFVNCGTQRYGSNSTLTIK